MSNLNFLQWNCRSIEPKLLDLENTLLAKKIHVACITETWLTPGQSLSVTDFNIVRQDRPDGWGGAALLLRNDILYDDISSTINGLADVQHVAVKLRLHPNRTLHVVVLYNGARRTITSNDWEIFFNAVPNPKLICGDFNVHGICFGSSYTTGKGVHLIDALESVPLSYLNNGAPTMVPRPRFPLFASAVDLTLVSPNLAASFEWEVNIDPMGSDHYPICFSCISYHVEQTTYYPSRRWNIEKADWGKFQAHLLNEPLDSQCSYQEFMQTITRACDVAIPQYKPFTNSRKGATWWSPCCEKALKIRKQAATAYKFLPNGVNFDRYLACHNAFRDTINKAKQSAWNTFCGKLNRNTPMREIWSMIKKIKNSNLPTRATLEDGEWVLDALTNYAPPFVPNDMSLRSLCSVSRQPTIPHFLLEPFSLAELEIALRHHNNTAPGADSITYPIMSHLTTAHKAHLLQYYNSFWQHGSFPAEWSKVTLIPILKPGKTKGIWSSYRLISLSSCIQKTMERLVKLRLEWWVEHHKLFSATQYGFRVTRSVSECHAQLVCSIHQALANKRIVLALFLDFFKAYDCVQLDLLAEKLLLLQFPPNFVRNILALASYREVYIKINNNFIGPRTANQGLSQGGILSPIMYSLFTSDLDSIVPEGLQIVQYADDVCVYTECSTMEEGIQQLEAFVKRLPIWCNRKGLEVSVAKSLIVPFTRKRNAHNVSTITLAGLTFSVKKEVKFLGLWLDRVLTWKCHIDNILNKCEKYINILRAVASSKWGADPKICLLFYRATIRSIIDFGCIYYGQGSQTHLNKVARLQNKCLRLCLGMLKSTPVDVLCAEASELPITYRRELLSDRFLLRLKSQNNTVLPKIARLTAEVLTSPRWERQRIPLIVNSFTLEYCNFSALYVSCIPLHFNIPYNIAITPISFHLFQGHKNATSSFETNKLFLEYIHSRWQRHIKIFTDGSKNPNNSAGCAFLNVTHNTSQCFKLPNICSSFMAEVSAIQLALKYICNHLQLMKPGVAIFTDSLSSLHLISSAHPRKASNPLVAHILQSLYHLRTAGVTINFIWIKGHSGITHNETVDGLAKLGAESGEFLEMRLPREEFLPHLRRYYEQLWGLDFNLSHTGRFYKTIQRFPPRKPWFVDAYIDRPLIVALCRLRSNHGLSPNYLFTTLKTSDSPQCIYCGDGLGDFEHLVIFCPIFDSARQQLFDALVRLTPVPFNYLQLLSDRNCFTPLYEYIRTCAIPV